MKTWKKLRDGQVEWKQYWIREKVIDTVRAYFKSQNFHEAYTPVLVSIPSCEPNLEPFSTKLMTQSGDERAAYLIMSPEYALKKMVAAGSGNIFEITRGFRNKESVSSWHNPEFCMLEWYRVGENYKKIMQDCEELICEIIKANKPSVDLRNWKYINQNYDLSLPWPRMTVNELFKKYCGIDEDTLVDREKLVNFAEKKGYKFDDRNTWDEVFGQLFFNEIEPKLRQTNKPCFVYEYPMQAASLAKVSENDGRFAQRFELFLAGIEIGNCFTELTDAKEQRRRFEKELEEREHAGKSKYGMDEDLLEALETMPETAGIAVGLDRVIMLAAGVESIEDTLVFGGREVFDL